MTSSYSVRERVVEVSSGSTGLSSHSHQSGSIQMPTLTWEQYVLINVELERLSLACRSLAVENESLKQQVSGQGNLLTEMDRLRRENESLKLTSARSSEQDLRMTGLIQENQKLLSQVSQNLRELESWRLKYSSLEVDLKKSTELHANNEHLLADLRRLREQLSSFESLKVSHGHLTTEKEMLKQTLIEKDKIIFELRTKLTSYEREIATMDELKGKLSLLASENERLNMLNMDKTKELESLRIRVAQGGDFESRLQIIIKEKEQMNIFIQERLREIETHKAKIAELERELRKYEELRDKVGLLAAENEKLNGWLVERSREIELLRAKTGQANDLELRYQALIKEKEQMNIFIQDRLKEIEMLRVKLVEYEKEIQSYNELKGKLSLLASENERLNMLNMDKTKELESLRLRVAQGGEFESKLQIIIKEKEQMNIFIQERLKEIEVLKARIIELERGTLGMNDLQAHLAGATQEIQRLTKILIERDTELADLKAKFQQVSQAEQRVMLLLSEKERIQKQLEQLNVIIIEKTREIEMLRAKANEAEHLANHVKHLGDEKNRLSEVVVVKTKENEGLKNTAAMVPHLEGKIQTSEGEKENLRLVIQEREKTINELRIRISTLERSGASIEELQSKLILLSTENERLIREVEILRKKASEPLDIELRYQAAIQERDRLNSILAEKLREIDQLRGKTPNDRFSDYINELESRVAKLMAENQRLSGLVTEVSQDRSTISRITTHSNNADAQVHGLIQDRERLTRETEHLKSIIGQLERTSHVSHVGGSVFDDSQRLAQENQQLRMAVQDWQNKYSVLENLYVSLRETTEQLGVIQSKNQSIINMSEQAEPRLKRSIDTKVNRVSAQTERPLQSGYVQRDTVSSQGSQPYVRPLQMGQVSPGPNVHNSPQRFQTEPHYLNSQRQLTPRDTVNSQGGFFGGQNFQQSAQRPSHLSQSAAYGRDTVNSQSSAQRGTTLGARFTTNVEHEDDEPIRYI